MSRNIFSLKSHTHLVSQISDYEVDDVLSKESSHPIQNRTVTKAIDMVVADQKLLIPGIIYPYAGSADTVPDGFLLCDGREVERVKYLNLYNVIKDTYGDTGSLLTFKLPDLRGRVPLGASSDYTLASKGGQKDVTLTADQIPSHVHGLNNHTHTMSHTHTLGSHTHTFSATTSSAGAHTHTINMPYGKDWVSGQSQWSASSSKSYPNYKATSNSAGAHTHTISGTTSANNGNTGAASTSSTGAASGNTTSVGGGKPHSNMQPYIAINYIISTGLEYKSPTVTLPGGEVGEVVPIG